MKNGEVKSRATVRRGRLHTTGGCSLRRAAQGRLSLARVLRGKSGRWIKAASRPRPAIKIKDQVGYSRPHQKTGRPFRARLLPLTGAGSARLFPVRAKSGLRP